MTYRLQFHELAQKEWRKLGETIRRQFVTKLHERLENPHVPPDQLRGTSNRYKIKLRQAGYRLVYEVRDDVLIVQIIAVGKRERSTVYRRAAERKN